MKRLLSALIISAVLVSCGDTEKIEIGNKTTIAVNPVFKAGKVLKGETINAVFIVKNTGDYPLVIADVKGSCTCTVVDKPEDPISPGETYTIKAEVDTDKTGVGSISKGITIVANTEPSLTTVSVQATVFEK